MALPNRINVNLVKEWDIDEDIVEVQNPRPDFVLRIRAKSATNLPNADFQLSQVLGMGGKASGSDPYCNIRIGGQLFRSVTLKNTCNPEWPSEGATADFAIYNCRQEVEFEVYDDDFGIGKDDFLVGTAMCVSDLLSQRSHVLDVHPAARKIILQNTTSSVDLTKSGSSKKSKGWDVMTKINPINKIKSLRSKKEKLEEVATLVIEVARFELVPFTESAVKKNRPEAGGLSEAVLGVTIYGMAPLGGKKTLEDTQNLVIRTTHRKKGQKIEDQRVTKRGKIRDDTPVPDGVDRNIVKMIQNLHLDPDFSMERISDVMEVGEDIVQKVLAMRKVMPLAYNELNYFFVGSCDDDLAVIDVIPAPLKGEKSKDPKGVIASLEMPVKDVIQATDHVISKSFIFTEAAKKNEAPQDYEVLLRFQVWALQETSETPKIEGRIPEGLNYV